jgi:DNA-binding response OmpR family regulator
VAYDGCTALEMARVHKPDVVLLDIGLPGFDGFEVARRLREQPESREVVLIAITGYGQETDQLRSRESGFDHHLVKPTDFGKLLDILANVMQEPDQAGDDNSSQGEETSSGSTLRALPPRR